jgi:2-amino-4-hydroxy-6-hydroxymethyldihydropteridine diphosphokinase
MANAYLFTGSNMGNRLQNIEQASALIAELAGIVKKKSAIYETEAWGNTNQEDFLNQALLVETTLSPEALLEKVLWVETKIGRQRLVKWEPRIIDIDILLYDDVIFSSVDLIIPHPYLHERRFTLTPLTEIAPDIVHPVLKKTIFQLLQACTDTLAVKLYNHAL